MKNELSMNVRMYMMLGSLEERGTQLITAGIDYTETPNPILHIKWQPLSTNYQLVLIAAHGLDGFSVYRVYGDEELSEDEVLFEFEHDSDISKV